MPGTLVAPCFSRYVAAVRVEGFMATLKVAVTVLLSATSTAVLSGSVAITVGAAPVVNVQV